MTKYQGSDRGRRVPHAGDFNQEPWWDLGYGSLNKVIGTMLVGQFEAAFRDYPPTASLPFCWPRCDGRGGEPVSDPLTLFVTVDALGTDEFEGPTWSFNIEDMIFYEFIQMHERGSEGPLGEEGALLCSRLRDRLREVASKIDERIARRHEWGVSELRHNSAAKNSEISR